MTKGAQMAEQRIPLIDGPVVTTPGVAVLWHYADDPRHPEGTRDRWRCVGLFGDDELDAACEESLRERPAMEPGHAVVATLSPLSLVRRDGDTSRETRLPTEDS